MHSVCENNRSPETAQAQDAFYAMIWLDELRDRLAVLEDELQEPGDSMAFQYWIDRYLNLQDQINLLERTVGTCS